MVRGMRQWVAATMTAALIFSACGTDTTGTVDDGGTNTSNPIDLPEIATGLIGDRYTAEVAATGTVAYTTTWGSRPLPGNTTYVWDTSKPTPLLVDSLQMADVSTMGDVQISPDGKYLVIATERANGSILVYDRTNPLHPTFATRFSNAHTSAGVHTVKLSVVNGKLYGFLQIDPGAGSGARETIVDMSNLANITEVYSQVMGRPYVHDVYVRDGYLFAALWHDGMAIFDIGGGNSGGTPANPILLGGASPPPGYIHNIWWYHDGKTGSKKYAFLGEEGPASVGSTSSGDIHVVDVSNVTNPKEVAIMSVAGAGTHNFWVDEESGILYAAYYNAGVRAIDVRGDLGTCTASQKTLAGLCSLNAMGRVVGKALTSGGFYVWGVQGVGNRLYASDMNSGLRILDITALKRP